MELKEVQEFIKSNADKEEVKNYIKGFITPDGVKTFIDSDDGQKLIQPKLDQYFTKGLETWKTNNLQKIVDEQVDKIVTQKYPKETEEQKRLHRLETDLAAETGKRKKAEILMEAISYATARGLPVEMVKHCVKDDIDSTKAALLEYEQVAAAIKKNSVDAIFKQNGRIPDKGQQEPAGLLSREDVAKMSQKDVLINRDKIHESMKHW
jgi:hypothetical protein